MRLIVLGLTALLSLAPAACADDSAKDKSKQAKTTTPSDEVKALKAELEDALQAAKKAHGEATSEQEKRKIIEEFQKKVPEYAGKMMNLAEKHAKDKAAVDAISFVLDVSPDGPRLDKSVDILLKYHVNEPAVAPIIEKLASRESPALQKLSKGLLDKSTNNVVIAHASYAQAQILQKAAESANGAEAEKISKQAEELLSNIVTKYKSEKDLVEKAEGDLFVIRNLSVGKELPDIAGEDSDGKKFKLSDYRGKVVVLDFWAEW